MLGSTNSVLAVLSMKTLIPNIGAGHAAYTDRFHELARLVPHLVTLESRMIERYVYGLAPQIRGIGGCNRSNKDMAGRLLLISVVTKSKQVPVNTAKQSSPRAATSISTARPINTATPKPKVN
ncbi:hypothetical protein Tco_1334983 [Tanacetum coccineum]